MEKKEFKVGEVFQCGLVKVKVVESTLSGCWMVVYFILTVLEQQPGI